MLFIVQFVFASALVTVASIMVLFWLLLLAMSFGGQSGLMPWVAAGVILYGTAFVAIAAVIGVPGIVWSRHLASVAHPKWQRLAKAPGWIGTATLLLGLSVSVAVLAVEQFRPKSKPTACISYRDAAASPAMAASDPVSIPDCHPSK
jgi:hypothetical protein